MQTFIRNFRSDTYRFTHSALMPLHLLVPVLGAGIFLLYYNTSRWDEVLKVEAYLQALALVFPFLTGIIVVMASEQELHAGGFQLLLACPGKRQTPHLSKLSVLLLFGLFACAVAVCGFGAVFTATGHSLLPMSFFWQAALLLFLGNMPLYLLEYLLSFSLGKGIGLGLGLIGSLLSALLITGLGEGIWPFLPWGAATRYCTILVESNMKGLAFLEASGVKTSLLFLVVYCVVLLFLLVFWSKKWEGRKVETE